MSTISRLLKTCKYNRLLLRRYLNTTTISQPGGKFTTDMSAYSQLTHGVTPLNSYGIIKLSGIDSSTFLQGLVTNDIYSSNNTYNAILTPKGKYLYDCFVSQQNDNDYLIESDINVIPHLIKYFQKYKLRKKINITNMSDQYRVWSVLTSPKLIQSIYNDISQNDNNILCYIDPRYNQLGLRLILNSNDIPLLPNEFQPIGDDFYNILKCVYGIPSYPSDLISSKTIILESNFNYINGVDFHKGCYIGQELIARTQYRGQIRKRLFGATIVNENDCENDNDCELIQFNNDNDDRDTVFPNEYKPVIIDNELVNQNIINNNNDIVGTVISTGSNLLNCCISQLRFTAFNDINADKPLINKLKIENSNYCIIPHFQDYFKSFPELFAIKG